MKSSIWSEVLKKAIVFFTEMRKFEGKHLWKRSGAKV